MLNFKKINGFLLCLSAILACSCSQETQKNNQYFGFNTIINIKYAGNVDEKKEDFFATTISKFDMLFNAHNENGTIYKINQSANEFVDHDGSDELLKIANDYKSETNNVFNPYLKYVSDLWKDSLSNDNLPSFDDINFLNSNALLTSIEIKESQVKLVGDGRIDLGGIAKGYLLSKLKPFFSENSITNFIVDAGSSSILLGEAPSSHNNGFYDVGIYKNNPTSPSRYLRLKNTAIGTSSIYEQKYLKIGDKIYSHCINGKNGSAEVVNDMVVVIGEDPIMCDVYSTVGMVSTIEEIKYIESVKPLKFLLFSNDEITYQNADIQVYIR